MPPPPPPYNTTEYHVVFQCKVDKRQYRLPIIFICIFDVIILIGSPNILWGIFGVLFGMTPLVFVLFFSKYLWDNVTYTIDDKVLRVSTPFKSLIVDIDNIKKIRRGKFWVERGRNYSASYTKLRIIYDRNSYIYVSPENEEFFVNILQTINPTIVYSSERNV